MKHLVLFGLFVTLALSAQAQESYTPPPMFGAQPAAPAQPAPAPPAAQQLLETPATNVAPGVSPKPAFRPRYSPSKPSAGIQPQAATPENKYTGTNNPLLPPVVTKGDPALEKPEAPAKPKKAVAVKAPKPAVKPAITKPVATAPSAPKIDVPAPQAVKKPANPAVAKPSAPVVQKKSSAMPASRVTSEGVVKGPKTMPSVPTTDVAAESTFEAPADSQTMMERHQSQQKVKVAAATPAAAPPKAAEKALATVPAAPPVQKLTIPFKAGLTSAEAPEVQGLAAALAADPSSRLMIEAYANPVDDGENSDRRLSLARALSVRKALVAAGAPPHRLDIRALGRKTAESPVDRVDVTLYNGRKSAN